MNQTNFKTKLFLKVLPFALFFLLGTFYLYYFTNYIFFYQEKSILFQVSFSYLLEHFNQPGGFLKYLGELQTTFYYYPLLGAIIIALELSSIIFIIQKIGQHISGRTFYFLPFFVGSTLFYFQTNYQYLAFNNLAILIQLALFYRIVSYSKNRYLWISVLLFPVNYFLFGSFSVVLICLLSSYLMLKKEFLKLSLALLGTGLFFFIGQEFLFFQTTNTLLTYPFTKQDVGSQTRLFLTIIFLILFLVLLFQVKPNRVTTFAIKNIKIIELSPLVIIVVLAVLVVQRIDKKNSHYFYVEKLFYQQKYDELIQFNTQFPSTNILTAFLNNVALAETGRLSDSFFRFPQTPDGSTLFQKWEMIGEVLRKGGYFYYSVGMINEAQRWAYEYMVMSGLTPETLKMLIKTELINGNYKMAEKYISILHKTIFYRDVANDFEGLLFDDSAIKNHPEYGTKSALKPKSDFFILSDDPILNLDFIIEADSTNYFALEYKLAWLLLQKDMQGIVDLLPAMEKAGYKQIPRNVEEAVVSYKLLKVGEMPDLKELRISTQTAQRFQQFYQIFQQNQGNKQQAQRALATNFSDTYWYYVFFQ